MKPCFKVWFKAAGIRAIKTVARATIATIGPPAAMGDVNWALVASSAALAGVLSLLTSVAGLPECKDEKETPEELDTLDEGADEDV